MSFLDRLYHKDPCYTCVTPAERERDWLRAPTLPISCAPSDEMWSYLCHVIISGTMRQGEFGLTPTTPFVFQNQNFIFFQHAPYKVKIVAVRLFDLIFYADRTKLNLGQRLNHRFIEIICRERYEVAVPKKDILFDSARSRELVDEPYEPPLSPQEKSDLLGSGILSRWDGTSRQWDSLWDLAERNYRGTVEKVLKQTFVSLPFLPKVFKTIKDYLPPSFLSPLPLPNTLFGRIEKLTCPRVEVRYNCTQCCDLALRAITESRCQLAGCLCPSAKAAAKAKAVAAVKAVAAAEGSAEGGFDMRTYIEGR